MERRLPNPLRRILFIAFALYLTGHNSLQAQPLKWRTESPLELVYQISNKEARKLLTSARSSALFESMLHTQVDTFRAGRPWLRQPDRGHFIVVRAVANKLHCRYLGVLPYQVFLLHEYNALSLQVVDSNGEIRTDARVKLGLRRIPMDRISKTYRVESEAFMTDQKYVTVELGDFLSVFQVSRGERPYWSPSYYEGDQGPDFYSYMITDKNRYKPGEKVRVKSFALNHNRSPIQRELEIWVNHDRRNIMVGRIRPHRPGSFAGEFQLNDTLRLELDKRYQLSLRDKEGRTVASCWFKYEDYELTGDKLDVALGSQTHYAPAGNEVIVNAYDVNGFRLPDARVNVVVRAKEVTETFGHVVYVPDTLLATERDLDASGDTRIMLSPELFGKTNMTYEVTTTLISSLNRNLVDTRDARFRYQQYEINARYVSDSIVFEALNNGSVMLNVPARITHDVLPDPIDVVLPFRMKINPAIRKTVLVTSTAERIVNMETMALRLEILGGIEKDSIRIAVDNPQGIEYAWFIYRGSELLDRGSGTDLTYSSFIEDRDRSYYVELLYAFAGEERIRQKEFQFNDRQLDIAFDVPDRVYPGQSVDATITVTNQAGDPVAGVDLTAFGVTAKLNYIAPDLPDYGTKSLQRTQPIRYHKRSVDNASAIRLLDYKKWATPLGLDTMKYYQFIYPGNDVFRHETIISDSTQFAVYAMRDGQAMRAYVVEWNHEPVHFSWTTNPKRYAFYAKPNVANTITLRLFDRVLIVDSLRFRKGTKTLVSIDVDHLPQGVREIKLPASPKRKRYAPSKFTTTEVLRYTKYLAVFSGHDAGRFLVQGDRFVALRNPDVNNPVVAGPIAPGRQTADDRITFTFHGGSMYEFEGNIIYRERRDNLLPTILGNDYDDPRITLNHLVLNRKAFLARDSALPPWITRSIDVDDARSRITITLPEDKQGVGVNQLLFQNLKSGRVSTPCTYIDRSTVYSLPRTPSNIIVIYNNGRYLKTDSVALRGHQRTFITFHEDDLQNATEQSLRWLTIDQNGCLSRQPVKEITLRRPAKSSGWGWGGVTGTIMDETGHPMPGVNIVIKGTVYGTVTDLNGNFSLELDYGYGDLVVSFIGYRMQEIAVRAGSVLGIQLEPDVTALQEVVVVGYGVSERRDLTGSVTIRGMTTALGGRIAGVSVFSSHDEPEFTQRPVEASAGAEQQLYEELLNLSAIRSNFIDVAFWEPRLFTDRKGQSKFTILFPEDITQWIATVYAMDRRLHTGTVRKAIRSYKPIMAQLEVPRFLTSGDSANAMGTVVNHSEATQIHGMINWEASGESHEAAVAFDRFQKNLLPVIAGDDSVRLRFSFKRSDGYFDGEERIIPVVPQGALRHDGTLRILDNNDEIVITPGIGEEITVELLADQLDIYRGEARYLIDYRYACNEQLASKLLGLIGYRNICEFEGKRFHHGREVQRIVNRLLKNQNTEFLWSWWDVSQNTNYWMSAHILRALKIAKDAGFDVDLDVANIARKTSYRFEMLKNYSYQDVDLLQALALWAAPIDFQRYTAAVDKLISAREVNQRTLPQHSRTSLLREKLLLLETKQLAGLPYERNELIPFKRVDIRGGVSFAESLNANDRYGEGVLTNVVAYRIVRRDSTLSDLIAPMQVYFVSARNKGSWNTYQSSSILTTVLPDLLTGEMRKKNPATVSIRDHGGEKTITAFPFRMSVSPGETVSVRKTGGMPLFMMQYRTERVTHAVKGGEGFDITARVGDGSGNLTAGKPVVIKVDVDVTSDATGEYVMIEIPVPASCSYTDNRARSYTFETHREYYKDRVNIYCERLKAGRYQFEVEVMPRFTGRFHVNPAQVSLMYLPVINANTDMEILDVLQP